MTADRNATEDWLGPALPDTTPEQVDLLAAAFATIAERYDGQDDEEAAELARVSAAQVILGEDTAESVAAEWRTARRAERDAMARLTGALIAEVGNGAREATLAAALDLNRGTVRKALGK